MRKIDIFKLIFVGLVSLLLAACGGKFDRILPGNTTRVTFSNSNGASSSAKSRGVFRQFAYEAQNGGIIIWGKSSTQYFSVSLANDSVTSPTLSLQNGDWVFYAIGWAGNSSADPMQGNVRCASASASLTGNDAQVNINLVQDCQTGLNHFFGAATFFGTSVPTPLPISFVSCSSIPGAGAGTTNCDGNLGDLKSYTISLGTISPTSGQPGQSSTTSAWTSACQTQSGSFPSQTNSSLVVPVGDGTSKALYTYINGYNGGSCSGSPAFQFVFPSGLAGPEASGSASVVSSGGRTYIFLAHAPPTISGTVPAQIPSSTSASFLIQGTNFSLGSSPTVTVGSTTCSVQVLDTKNLICTLPATGVAPSTYTITVTNPNGLSATYSISALAGTAPTISSISPGAITAAGGDITISGSNFSGSGDSVFIDGNSCSISSDTSTSIICTVPSSLPYGNYAVTVINASSFGSISPQTLHIDPVFTLATVSPLAITPANTSITLGGTNFSASAIVNVGGLACPVTSFSPSSITCTAPGASLTAGGIYDVSVINSDGLTKTINSILRVSSNAPPSVASIFPTAGTVGASTAIDIHGNNFSNGTFFSVSVGGVSCASSSFVDSTKINCNTSSSLAVGTYPVVVVSGDGLQSTTGATFTVSANAAPTLTGSTPSTVSSALSTTISFAGASFVSGATVMVGGTACTSVNFVNSGTLTCTLPAGMTAGTYPYFVQNPDGQVAFSGSSTITVVDPPSIASIFPTAGIPGTSTQISIIGSGFVSGATVSVGGVTCTSPSVNGSNNITCLTSSSLSLGSFPVVVTNPDTNQSTQTVNFTVTSDTPPSISTFSPTTVSTTPTSPATVITVTGSGFVSGAQVRIGSYNCSNVVWVDATRLTCNPPSGMTAGTFPLYVANPDGLAIAASGNITVTADIAPSLTNIFPSAGHLGSSTVIELDGSGFSSTGGGIQVTVGGTPCTSVSFINSSRIKCNTDSSLASGAYAVVFTNGDGLRAPQTQSFSVSTSAAPAISGTNPYSIPMGTSRTISLIGSNFSSTGATVEINRLGTSVACASPSVSAGNTVLTCTLPATLTSGFYDIVELNSDGQASYYSPIFVDDSFGDGTDGSPSTITSSITTTATLNETSGTRTLSASRNVTNISSVAADGSQILTLGSTISSADFSALDEIAWHVSAGSPGACETSGNALSVGKFGFAHIINVNTSTPSITIDNPITANPNNSGSNGIASTNRVAGNNFCLIQVLRVPNYQNFSLASASSPTTITPAPFSMSLGTGGIFIMRVSGTLGLSSSGSGSIGFDAKAAGYGGGPCAGNCSGSRGDGMLGLGSSTADTGGPGASSVSGAGGGGNAGTGGPGGNGPSGGAAAYPSGSCKPSTGCAMFGGGGGAGYNTSSTAFGGNGGGIVLLYANTIAASSVSNFIVSAYGAAPGAVDIGGPAGGAGGTALLQSKSMSIPNVIVASDGSLGSAGVTYGGGGGGGGISEIRYCAGSGPSYTSGFPSALGGTGGTGSSPGTSGSNGYDFDTSLSSGTYFCP